MWERRAQRAGVPVWKLAGLDGVRPLLTTFTVGADDPAVMAERAAAFTHARALKLKLTGDAELDAPRLRSVRARFPDPWTCGDATQGHRAATPPPQAPPPVQALAPPPHPPPLPRPAAETHALHTGPPLPP